MALCRSSRPIARKIEKWRCYRLAARINELRDYGWDIETEKINKNGVSYAKYGKVNHETKTNRI